MIDLMPGRARGCRFVRLAEIPMRDGVRLAASIFLPEAEGRYPTVLQRLPYNRLDWLDDGERWARAGYVYVCQDTRGRYDSGGEFDPFLQEISDTPDTIAWIREQAWSDGRVGQMGPSYLAWVQTLAIALGEPPFADAVIPTFAPCTGWRRGWYSGGPFSLALAFRWMCFDAGSRVNNTSVLGLYDVDELYRRLPLQTLDVSSGAGEVALWREAMAHPTYDEYWDKFSILDRYDRFTMPSLHIAGWYDYYAAEMIADWQRVVSDATSEAPHRLIIGPWGHHHGLEPTADGRRAVDFGPDSGLDPFQLYRSWFDRIFHGETPSDGVGERPIRLFVMGANRWRDEDEWPLARTRYTKLYLHSAGGAATLDGDGVLSTRPPDGEPPDRYTYDPQDPVPTLGGNHSITPGDPAHDAVIWCGPCDQRPNERRRDVLVYTSEPLQDDLEVTGPVVLQLWASSSARDTDFVGRLVDVYPDGMAINVTEGVVRARYRAGDGRDPALIEPGRVLEYTVDLQCTSMVFLRGHRLRLEVTSSNFPLWDRNLNNGDDGNTSTEIVVADQEIWHDTSSPSHLVLPIIGTVTL